VKHLVSICERKDLKTLELHTNRISLNKNWSLYVENILHKRCEKSYRFDDLRKTVGGRWLVSSHRQGEIVHNVNFDIEGDLESFAACTCGE
jgi:hypothetical protein